MAYHPTGMHVLAQVDGPYKPRRGLWAPGVVLDYNNSRGRGSRPYHVRLDEWFEGNQEYYFSSRCLVRDTARNRRTRKVQSK